jgi:hypothetical protein
VTPSAVRMSNQALAKRNKLRKALQTWEPCGTRFRNSDLRQVLFVCSKWIAVTTTVSCPFVIIQSACFDLG